jgi:hypothetical protein
VSDLAIEVRRRAASRCEYCQIPEAAFRRPFHIEHIVAKQHGGLTLLDNLALACWACNLKKGPNLTGIDPESREITRLFDPRKDRWDDHFKLIVRGGVRLGVDIRGRTALGRTTVRLLDMNNEMRKRIRHELWREGMIRA